ncbi:MAG: hypothetical protein K8W52_00055 [Deltaproteobacteria bacterium]|nr:hypothetical protein [Deltaproteobacteria bacterium]
MASLRSAFVLATLAAAAGCAADSGDSPLLILANAAPADGCTFSASASGSFFATGIVDVLYAGTSGTYVAAPLVENTTIVDETNHPELVSHRTANLRGLHVSITFTDDAVVSAAEQASMKADGLLQFDARFAGTVAPNGGTGAFPVEVVSNALLQRISTAINGGTGRVGLMVDMRAFGDLGGDNAESASFQYPVEVCTGCLTNDLGPCSSVPKSFTPRTGGICDFRQDGVVDCCSSLTGAPVCPAIGTQSGT